jgi:hypothetical protein
MKLSLYVYKLKKMNLIKFFPLLFLLSCADSTETTEITPPKKYLEYEVLIIDSCEYLVYGRYDNGNQHSDRQVLTHKGNCKNPIHQCK